jgi:hypothetical protein
MVLFLGDDTMVHMNPEFLAVQSLDQSGVGDGTFHLWSRNFFVGKECRSVKLRKFAFAGIPGVLV